METVILIHIFVRFRITDNLDNHIETPTKVIKVEVKTELKEDDGKFHLIKLLTPFDDNLNFKFTYAAWI